MKIERSSDSNDLNHCAMLMSASEPWITLRRNHAQCLAALEGDIREVYVAKEGVELMGFAVLQMVGTFKGYLQTLCVAPTCRGQGLGTLLVRHCEERIFRESPNVFICVSTFNPDAERLYLRLGYQRVGVLEDFIVPGHGEILLRKSIGSWSTFRPG